MAKKISKKKRSRVRLGGGPRGAPVEIRDVDDLEENHVALFYGKSGRGKTETAATFPTKLLFLDINNEKGLKTVRGRQGIQVAKVQTWDEFLDMYWWLEKGQNYKSLVLDQITGLQDMAMSMIRAKRKKTADELFTRKNWGELSGELKTWLHNYRELVSRYNIVFLAHERAFSGEDEADEDEIDPTVSARVMPSVGSFVDGACDIIGHNFIRSVNERNNKGKKVRRTEYCMRVGPHPIYVTKIRRPPTLGPLPDFIVDPSYQKLVNLEAGKEEVKTRVVKKKARRR